MTNITSPAIRRGAIRHLNIFEIKEGELETLEKGLHNSIFLNFAIFFFSISISFFISLKTTEISSINLITIFYVVTFVGLIGGMILFLLWLRNRKDIPNIIKNIRDRLTQYDGIQDSGDKVKGQIPINLEEDNGFNIENICKIMVGKWSLNSSESNKPIQTENLEINKTSQYFIDGNLVFILSNIFYNYDSKEISFDKMKLDGRRHSREILIINNESLLQGYKEDNKDYLLKYEK